MGEPKVVGIKKERAPRGPAKPKTYGQILGAAFDQFEALPPEQRGKLLAALAAQFPTNGITRGEV
jgi:hypothetical protein